MVEDRRINGEEERKQLNKDGWTSSVKLSRVPDIGWTITMLAMSIKARGKGPYFGPKDVLRVRNSPSACGTKYYYREEEIVPAMIAFSDYCTRKNLEPGDVQLDTVREFWIEYHSS